MKSFYIALGVISLVIIVIVMYTLRAKALPYYTNNPCGYADCCRCFLLYPFDQNPACQCKALHYYIFYIPRKIANATF